MELNGRQINNIRKDHLERYMTALKMVEETDDVLDCACGSGYGTKILSAKTKRIVGYDIDEPTINLAKKTMPDIDFRCSDLQKTEFPKVDKVISFETIEHLDKPEDFLNSLDTKILIGSVPNEDINPFNPYKFIWHKRHYTLGEITELLTECGFELKRVGYQHGKESEVVFDDKLIGKKSSPGMTIVFVAEKC